MRRASERVADSAEKTVRDIRKATRRRLSAEEFVQATSQVDRERTPQLAQPWGPSQALAGESEVTILSAQCYRGRHVSSAPA